MSSFWIQTPSDSVLSDMRGWAQIDGNKYAAIRHHLLVVQRHGGNAKNGPIHKPVEWPVNTEYHMEEKITKVTKYTLGIEESITSTVTTKLSQEVLSKIGLSAGLDITNLGARLSTEVQSKIGAELVESLQSGLSTTKTYEVETKTEQTESLDIKVAPPDGSKGTRDVFIYFKLNQLFWDVYLYQTDYLQLEYKRRWYWTDVRKTILSDQISVKKPLFSIAYFEPVPAFSFRYDNYVPEIDDGNVVQSLALMSTCPTTKLQPDKSMEELAQSAFPVSRAEVRDAKETRRQLGGAKGGSKAGRYIGGAKGGGATGGSKGGIKRGAKSTAKVGAKGYSGARGHSKGGSYGGSKTSIRKPSGSKGGRTSKGALRSGGGSRGSAKR
jgi:hypothetical protein